MEAIEKYAQIEGQVDQTVKALEGITPGEVDWKPVQHEKVRSIGDMFRHVVSVEDTLINRWILGKDVQPRTPQTHASPDKLISEMGGERSPENLYRSAGETDDPRSHPSNPHRA